MTVSLGKYCNELKCIKDTPARWAEQERRKVLDGQAKIPINATLLAHISKPFLLDFNRNTIYIADWPGGSGPPPGLPCLDTAENVAQYLRNNGVRYVMYSYADEAGFPVSGYGDRLYYAGGYFSRMRETARYTFAFHNRLIELSRQYKIIYDDGNFFISDLKTPSRTKS